MGEILLMVKRVTVFLLGATMLTRLFGGTEYKKYLDYAAGLILIALVAAPFLAVFGKDTSLENWVFKGVFEQRTEEMREEMRLLGAEYEQAVLERYEKQVCQDMARFCGVEEENCRVFLADGGIERIEVTLGEGQPEPDQMQMSVRYGVDADSIFFVR